MTYRLPASFLMPGGFLLLDPPVIGKEVFLYE